jgi:hypothetical protein
MKTGGTESASQTFSFGNGEVDSSILSGSTSYRLEIAKLSLIHFPDELRVSPKGTTP